MKSLIQEKAEIFAIIKERKKCIVSKSNTSEYLQTYFHNSQKLNSQYPTHNYLGPLHLNWKEEWQLQF